MLTPRRLGADFWSFVVAITVPLAALAAQTAPMLGHWEPVHVHSGLHANPSPVEGTVWRGFVFLPATRTPWVRLYFSACQLDKGSYLRLVSLRDGDVQTLHMHHVEQWSHSSAYFNGHGVMVEIVAAPGSTKNYVNIDKVFAGDVVADLPPPETICGATDDRVPSTDPAAARIVGIGCSGWIISTPVTANPNERLHLSAGHCFATGQVLQFNVPASGTSCALANPPATHQFAIDSTGSASTNTGIGNDFWVFRCFANSNSGLTTFQTMNAAYALATSMPVNGTTLRNYGYGLDGTPTNGGANAGSCGCASPSGARNQTQQTHTGSLVGVTGTALTHTIDTCGGNSGSVLLNNATGVAVAIHTNAGCSAVGGSNSGTAVTNTALLAAITAVATGNTTPPANDGCATATTVLAGTNGPFNNNFATDSTAFPCAATAGRDVWFKHTAGCTGSYTISTCTATRGSFDTVLQVFSGTCAALTSLGCNDDINGACTLGSQVTVSLTAGQQYFVRVGGFGGAQGSFDVVVTAPCVPANECVASLPLTAGANGSFSTVAATTSAPAWACGSGANDIWFSYAAPRDSQVTFSTCNAATTFDTVVQVFAGTCAGLTSLGCNDDEPTCSPGTRSRLSVNVTSATTLFVRVGGFNGATGFFQLDVTRTPTNNECATAVTVNNGTNALFNTAGATTSQAWPCGTAGNDVWCNYTATCNGQLAVSTCTANRSFDTVLEVFSGACGALVSMGCSDDAGGSCGDGSSLTVPVLAGQTYRIRIGGFLGSTGQTDLVLGCVVANDECVAATPVIAGTNGPFSSVGATTSVPPPGCGSSPGNDVWFSHVAACTAPTMFSTCTAARTFDTQVEVFSGACGALTAIGCNDDTCALGSRVTANLTLGQQYFVRVSGTSGATGTFDLTVETGTGTGSFVHTGAACGSLSIAHSGSSNIGGTFTMSLSGVTAFPIIGYGFNIVPVPFCGCIVGHDWTAMDFTSSQNYPIPCNAAFIGIQVGFQGADFGATGGCPSPQLTASDTIVVTIG